MNRTPSPVAAAVLLALLVAVFYPVLFLGQRVAPESLLRAAPPWRAQFGPLSPAPVAAAHAARHLGPRLEAIARDGLALAVWNPLVGGGRGGWLSSPAEGGAPLPLLAAALAQRGWVWTALVTVELSAAYLACLWLLRRQRLAAWPAAAGALIFALSGPVASHLLDWKGSAVALGPLLVLPAFARGVPWRARTAAWAGSLLLAVVCGPPAWPFAAAGAALALLSWRRDAARRRRPAWPAGLTLALAVAAPVLWLERAAAEPGASIFPSGSVVPLHLRDLVAFSPAMARTAQAPPLDTPTMLFLGWPALVLAAAALASPRRREAAPWFGVAAVALAVSLGPIEGKLPHPLLLPAPVAALAVAVLAAFGLERVFRDLAPRAYQVLGAAACLAILASLLPVAVAGLPLAPTGEEPLPSPLAAVAGRGDGRAVGLVGAVPPDSAAVFGVADLRAADLRGEPAYAAALGASADGTLPLPRALDPALARLGGRWLVEPAPLRVTSSAIFAAVDTSDLTLREGPGRLRFAETTIPPGTTRVGFPANAAVVGVLARLPGRTVALRADDTLAGESDAWRWFAVPEEAAGGTLAVQCSAGAAPAELTVAWDGSGLAVVGESGGARVWERRQARPFVYLAPALEPDRPSGGHDPDAVRVPQDLASLALGRGRARIESVRRHPARVEVTVVGETAALLVVQVKYRPRLWRARVNGRPAPTLRADLVWTGIPLPAGRNEVSLAAAFPTWTVTLCLVGVAVGVGLALPWRRA